MQQTNLAARLLLRLYIHNNITGIARTSYTTQTPFGADVTISDSELYSYYTSFHCVDRDNWGRLIEWAWAESNYYSCVCIINEIIKVVSISKTDFYVKITIYAPSSPWSSYQQINTWWIMTMVANSSRIPWLVIIMHARLCNSISKWSKLNCPSDFLMYPKQVWLEVTLLAIIYTMCWNYVQGLQWSLCWITNFMYL